MFYQLITNNCIFLKDFIYNHFRDRERRRRMKKNKRFYSIFYNNYVVFGADEEKEENEKEKKVHVLYKFSLFVKYFRNILSRSWLWWLDAILHTRCTVKTDEREEGGGG